MNAYLAVLALSLISVLLGVVVVKGQLPVGQARRVKIDE
jgi:hypothetical protein